MLFSSKDDYGLSKGTKLEGLRPAYQPRYANSRTWGTPTELRQPQQQLPFIASLTCPRKSFARDDKFVATLISNHLADLSSRPKRSVVERSAVSNALFITSYSFTHPLKPTFFQPFTGRLNVVP